MPPTPLPRSIHITEPSPGYPVLEIHHPAVRARVTAHGAHLMEWTPAGHAPVLYLSPQAALRAGKAIRGGIPVCWPWFGPHETDGTLPAHGFARSRFWEMAAVDEDAAGVALAFTFRDDAETRRAWPHPFQLELALRLGAELRTALRMTNTGTEPFTITGALHTYLAVGDIRKATVRGLAGAEYLDTVGPHTVRRQEGDLLFTGEVDRDYRTAGEVQVLDAALGRTLTVRGAGSRCTVVWNPWTAKAAALTDLPDEDYLRFVCIETANAWKDRITLAPGETHVLETTVLVS